MNSKYTLQYHVLWQTWSAPLKKVQTAPLFFCFLLMAGTSNANSSVYVGDTGSLCNPMSGPDLPSS